MHIERFNHEDLARMLDQPELQLSTTIEAETPYTLWLKAALAGRLNLDDAITRWEDTGIPQMVSRIPPPHCK